MVLSLTAVLFGLINVSILNNVNGQSNAYPNRPTFHFVPVPKGWMNDPNGPFYDANTGLYHLMFQYYTPRQWGHAISTDLLTWHNLPIAIPNNTPYNKGGVYTGSTTVLPNAIGGYSVYITYSVNTNNMMCIAYPTDPNDVNLTQWTNYPENCVLNVTRDGVPAGRDPTTSWSTDNGKTWTFIYTAQQTYQTTDWRTWTAGPGKLFQAPSGIECPDFYELPKAQQFTNATHVVKVSMKGTDWWSFGSYDAVNTKFTQYNLDEPLFCEQCLFDFAGSWYAAKSFYDSKNDRQIIFGWLREQTGQDNNGWQGVQSLPRTMTLLNAQQSPTGQPWLKSYPIKEFDNLRVMNTKFSITNMNIASGNHTMFPVEQISGNTLDIEVVWNGPNGDCGVYVNGDGNAANKLGTQYTRVGVNHNDVNNAKTFYVQPNGQTATQETIPGWNGQDPVTVRIIVDHSVVEVFINGGIMAVTRRVYPKLSVFTVGVYSFQHNNGDSCNLSSFTAYNVSTVIEPPN